MNPSIPNWKPQPESLDDSFAPAASRASMAFEAYRTVPSALIGDDRPHYEPLFVFAMIEAMLAPDREATR